MGHLAIHFLLLHAVDSIKSATEPMKNSIVLTYSYLLENKQFLVCNRWFTRKTS